MAIVPCELEDSTSAKELEETNGNEEELKIAEEELCEKLEDDRSCEELDPADELEAGVSLFATPATAKSGAKPALRASMAPARYASGAFQLMATSFVA